jgi:NHLM bacteriocin system secretion protein
VLPGTSIFRQQALVRLATPETLDQRIRIVAPLGWLALLVCAAALAGALTWGVFGTYRMTVKGLGLLTREGGLYVDINAPKTGWVEELAPISSQVRKNDLLVRLRAPEEDTRVAGLQSRLRQITEQRKATVTRFTERLAAETQANNIRRQGLEQTGKLTAEFIDELENLLETRGRLAAKGNATHENVVNTRERLFSAREALAVNRADLQALSIGILTLQAQRDGELDALDQQARELTTELEQAMLSRALATEIRSQVDGQVVMTPVTRFSLVSIGQRLMVIHTGTSELEALLFVPAEEGKQVRPGMEVRVSPTIAKREEYGSLIGTVRTVSPVPIAQADIAVLIGNQDLARQFSADKATVIVAVELQKSVNGDGYGYAWTSNRGQSVTLDNGTLVSGDVAVRMAAPIELVLPALRRWTGL